LCIAVSTSPDPTGSYSRYQFSFDSFNDYPKMGLWPDGYYFTYNLFGTTGFLGARVCRVDRAQMLIGAPAGQVCFDTGPSFGGLLPCDLDGRILPPPGAPECVVAIGTGAIDLWLFGVPPTGPTAPRSPHSRRCAVAAPAWCSRARPTGSTRSLTA
jgi:hypothetical protein